MDAVWFKSNICYYLREKYYGNAKKIIKQALLQFPGNVEYLFYYGITNLLEGQIQKAISDLSPLQSEKEIQLAVVIALIYAYKLNNSSDKEVLYNLESKLKEEKKHGDAISFYYAGLFLSAAAMYEKASEYINKSLRKDPNNSNIIILKGWNDMYLTIGKMHISILDCLELALNKNDNNVEALLGLAKFKYFAQDYDASNLTLDRLIVKNPEQVIPLIEKMKNEFAMQKWEAVCDILERIFSIDPNNIEGLKTKIYLDLCKNSDDIEAADQLNKLFSILESEDSHNGYQFYNITQLFSRVCGRSSAILSQVYKFTQYASEMYSNNVDYLSEVGYQCILQAKYKDALSFFRVASKLDNNSITALCGLTLCQMLDGGSTEQIAQQVELLFEMQGPNKLPLLYQLSAQLNVKNSSHAVAFLNTAYETKIAYASRNPFSLTYIKDLDPDFLLEVYKEYKKHLPKKPYVIIGYLIYTKEGNDEMINHCFKILNTIHGACPGLIAALYELAKVKFLFGYSNDAQKLAQQIMELDSTHAGCQVLLAQIHIQQQSFTKAAQHLEMCLNYNFKVRDSSMYHFLNGIILKSTNRLVDSLTSLITSLQMATSKTNPINTNRLFDSDLNIIDKATLYVQIIELQTALEQYGEAEKTMQVK